MKNLNGVMHRPAAFREAPMRHLIPFLVGTAIVLAAVGPSQGEPVAWPANGHLYEGGCGWAWGVWLATA